MKDSGFVDDNVVLIFRLSVGLTGDRTLVITCMLFHLMVRDEHVDLSLYTI